MNPQRPRLAPLTASLCWGFAVINVLVGLGLALLYNTPIPLVIANLLSYQEWGIIFALLGIAGGFFLLRGYNDLVRGTQLVSVTVKSIWLAALLVRCVTAPQTVIITLVWGFFTYVQIMVYIHFDASLPRASHGVH